MPKYGRTMHRHSFLRSYLIAGLLVLASAASQALTLGRTRGVVLIGQPLAVDIALTLDASETASALCLEADVFHADTQVSASKVTAIVVNGSNAQEALLRIRSQSVVDEPFVMLFVRAGCNQKITRRYTLLADVAGDTVPAGITLTPAFVPPVLARLSPSTEKSVQPVQKTGQTPGRAARLAQQRAAAANAKRSAAQQIASQIGSPTQARPSVQADLPASAPPVPAAPVAAAPVAAAPVAAAPVATVVTPPASSALPEPVPAPPVPVPNAVPPVEQAKATLPPPTTDTTDKPAKPVKADKPVKTVAKNNKTTNPKTLDKAATAPRARLVIDPLELLAERAPTLKASPEMLSTPTENLQQRAASAALWRALNTPPLDLLSDLERVERVEAQANTVRSQNVQQEQRIGMLNNQLDKARAERYNNPLIYALSGLALLSILLSGFFWWRSRRAAAAAPAWWLAQKGEPQVEGDWQYVKSSHSEVVDPAVDSGLGKLSGKTGALGKKAASAAAHAESAAHVLESQSRGVATAATIDQQMGVNEGLDLDLDLDLSMPSASLRTQPMTASSKTTAKPNARPAPKPSAATPSDFMLSQLGMSRAVNTEELFDVQQQADFFVSLGQFDQAISVLKEHINDNVQTSALAYLDLLNIYHSLDRKVDYGLLRDEFHKVFNAVAPKFEDFGNKTRGLESYFVAMARIQALWPSPKVLDVIEESVFRKPGEEGDEAFDLEAYRDLILLHTLIKGMMEGGDAQATSNQLASRDAAPSRSPSAKRSEFASTNIQPLSALIDADKPLLRTEPDASLPTDLLRPPASIRLGLDFDLSKFDPVRTIADGDDAVQLGSAISAPPPYPSSGLMEFDLSQPLPLPSTPGDGSGAPVKPVPFKR